MVSVSAECWPLYWPRHLPIVGRYVDHHSANIPVDTSVDTSTNTSQSTYRLTPDWYVDWHIGPHLADMSTDTLVECRPTCWPRCQPIYQSRGAQNTHDPARLSCYFCLEASGNSACYTCLLRTLHLRLNPIYQKLTSLPSLMWLSFYCILPDSLS